MGVIGSHQYPTMESVIYGRPAAEALCEEAERLGATRVYLIASRTLNTTTDEIEKIRKALGDRHAATFDGVPQHTTRDVVVQIARQASEAKTDLVVAIGGGSVVDAAKIVLMCMEHEIFAPEGLDGFETTPERRFGAFRNPKVRMIAIPSTLSGGEYNSGALVTDTRRKLKQIFNHPLMMPRSIILDPAITRHTPEKLWLGSGTRAMDHGIEAICSSRPNVLVDAVCQQGLRYLHDGLLRTRTNPDDEDARLSCQLGSWLSAFGLQSRVPMGASHAIGHVLGGTCDVPHYFCTAVMMPSVLHYNRPATPAAQTAIAAALGAPGQDAGDAFAAFVAELGLPGSLADVGVTEDRFELISRNAMLSIFTRANPQPIREPGDIVKILEMAR
ncbi:iron-containing alcohol dehydrogenase [Bradyrhizobium sp. U87765 SZCCT0131]|uniref:iron-containing alcohol dehydrogenase n=1 Tax=unclassified Bradyrhizobium TaxID=2631580 RepID=UPI001BA9F3C4|nr:MULTISPECIES: iron-containing alcohol dehydrogenase [unclassified Bradyrhizobium]MBR1220637.1 iron-containing alcohol dehydrogenase [Bradyrhizobium sp. U87765 SZCCT0131]MBR1262909.1 iron-containing alcohol dehydrogenase [Bradyrhizobium sp. U87765 SZCCT0134]MBR1307209.1 iron-containing alcohol dehydrogenase [Bradyrhizobium sp. U87765 SZCCT0110]MBR1322904.1 iron-containing alcohol dehydrogenase [Bradyrhizobium sp. U87765 SZCCT0109]MBR1346163.1 iron-containing alcohol dehydrogenase [Bradyrhizo